MNSLLFALFLAVTPMNPAETLVNPEKTTLSRIQESGFTVLQLDYNDTEILVYAEISEVNYIFILSKEGEILDIKAE